MFGIFDTTVFLALETSTKNETKGVLFTSLLSFKLPYLRLNMVYIDVCIGLNMINILCISFPLCPTINTQLCQNGLS